MNTSLSFRLLRASKAQNRRAMLRAARRCINGPTQLLTVGQHTAPVAGGKCAECVRVHRRSA